MTEPIKDTQDMQARLQSTRDTYRDRDEMVQLCEEMYLMKRQRSSKFLGEGANNWRDKVAAEYWESSAKPQNVVDIMHAVLSGNTPQFHCTIPGNTSSTIPSRAEMFLSGVIRLNALRQQKDILSELIFKTVKHGAAGIRVYWMPDPPPIDPQVVENPDQEGGEPWVVHMHTPDTLPLCVDVVDIRNLYPGAKGAHGRPFDEIFYVQKRSVGHVLNEWGNRVDADIAKKIEKLAPPGERGKTQEEYVEWWGQDVDRVVWYAIMYKDFFLIEPTPTEYPVLPFVITTFKYGDTSDPSLERLPFIYPLFYAVDKQEYIRSRSARLIDMYANMNPYHAGNQPIQGVDATWGKIIELEDDEDIRFPQWPGQPPDVYREMQQLEQDISEGTFSQAMFGNVSTRISGYAMSQIIGSDTLRSDKPRRNLEIALTALADIMFRLMQVYAPNVHLAVVAQIRNRKLTSMLSGEETKLITVETFVKPKQTSDEVRLASLGAQIAALPNPPVSMRYILEHYFGVNQPEEELNRKMDEDAMKDPIIRMMAMHEVLAETGSPYAAIIQQQLEQAIQKTAQQQQQQSAPPGTSGVGLGLPQATGGNPPVIPGSGNPSEEAGPNPTTMMQGGPVEGERH